MSSAFLLTVILAYFALLLGMPFFVLFGHLSDRIGRKRIIMAGCLLAALAYVPIEYASPGTTLAVEVRGQPVKAQVVKTPFYRKPKK